MWRPDFVVTSFEVMTSVVEEMGQMCQKMAKKILFRLKLLPLLTLESVHSADCMYNARHIYKYEINSHYIYIFFSFLEIWKSHTNTYPRIPCTIIQFTDHATMCHYWNNFYSCGPHNSLISFSSYYLQCTYLPSIEYQAFSCWGKALWSILHMCHFTMLFLKSSLSSRPMFFI